MALRASWFVQHTPAEPVVISPKVKPETMPRRGLPTIERSDTSHFVELPLIMKRTIRAHVAGEIDALLPEGMEKWTGREMGTVASHTNISALGIANQTYALTHTTPGQIDVLNDAFKKAYEGLSVKLRPAMHMEVGHSRTYGFGVRAWVHARYSIFTDPNNRIGRAMQGIARDVEEKHGMPFVPTSKLTGELKRR